MENNNPRIGVAAIIRKDNKILLWKRKSPLGEGTRAFTGGKLEYHEDIIEAAKRETLEEAGISIQNCKVIGITNDKHPDSHRITIFVLCDYDTGEVKIMEPEKCEKRERFDRENFPTPLFLGIENLRKTHFHPFNNSISIFPE